MPIDIEAARARACAIAGVPRAAAEIVMEGLAYALDRIPGRRHVEVKEFVAGVACVSVDSYGLLAQCVLEENGIGTTAGLGRLVLALAATGAISKEHDDTIEGFARCALLFESAIQLGYEKLRAKWAPQWHAT